MQVEPQFIMSQEKYLGPVTLLIGFFLFWPILCGEFEPDSEDSPPFPLTVPAIGTAIMIFLRALAVPDCWVDRREAMVLNPRAGLPIQQTMTPTAGLAVMQPPAAAPVYWMPTHMPSTPSVAEARWQPNPGTQAAQPAPTSLETKTAIAGGISKAVTSEVLGAFFSE